MHELACNTAIVAIVAIVVIATGESRGIGREVADVVMLLVNNSYITRQTLHVNGGWYMT